MNLRDLRYLVTVAQTRHFGRAAERCFVSQPTLSAQIKKLETELGTPVFERTNRSVEVTPAGEAIIKQARQALDHIDRMIEIASDLRDPMAGTLRLGMIPTLAPYLVPLMLTPLIERYPQLDVALSEETTDVLLERLNAHSLDAILIATPVDDPDLIATALFDEPFWLVHPIDHALYDEDDIPLTMLKHEDLILLTDAHCLSGQIQELCTKHRINIASHRDLRASSMETLLQLVSAGFGCTLVPALATRGAWMTDTGVVAKHIKDKSAKRRVSLVHRASFPHPSLFAALVDVILGHLPNTVIALDAKGRLASPATDHSIGR